MTTANQYEQSYRDCCNILKLVNLLNITNNTIVSIPLSLSIMTLLCVNYTVITANYNCSEPTK